LYWIVTENQCCQAIYKNGRQRLQGENIVKCVHLFPHKFYIWDIVERGGDPDGRDMHMLVPIYEVI
jgi:hypothetical protein